MSALEAAAKAAEHAYGHESGSTGEPIDFEAIARAVLMAVRKSVLTDLNDTNCPSDPFAVVIDAILAGSGET